MNIIRGKDIPFSLQLVKSDATFESGATVQYTIYESDGSTSAVTTQATVYNSTINTYLDTLDVSADWSSQESGNFLLVWDVIGTNGFPSTMIEDLVVTPSATDVLGEIVEGTYSLKDVQKILVSVLAGESSGGGTPNLVFQDTSGTTDRITAVVDRKGNRQNIVLDIS